MNNGRPDGCLGEGCVHPFSPSHPDVYSAAIPPAQWAEMSTTLRAGMIATAPLTVQYTHWTKKAFIIALCVYALVLTMISP